MSLIRYRVGDFGMIEDVSTAPTPSPSTKVSAGSQLRALPTGES